MRRLSPFRRLIAMLSGIGYIPKQLCQRTVVASKDRQVVKHLMRRFFSRVDLGSQAIKQSRIKS